MCNPLCNSLLDYVFIYLLIVSVIHSEISLSTEPLTITNSSDINATTRDSVVNQNLLDNDFSSSKFSADVRFDHVIEKKDVITPTQSNTTTQSKNDSVSMETNEHPVIKAYVTDHKKEEQNHKKTMIPIGQLLDDGRVLTNDESDYFVESHDLFQRRFELYPKWYSHKIPSLFGKSFARRYFHPYERQISQRTHIERGEKGSRRDYPHELPPSWLPQQQEITQTKQMSLNELPQEFVEMTPGKISPMQRNHPPVNLANAVGEIVDIPDQQRTSPENIIPPSQLQQSFPQQQQELDAQPQILRPDQTSEQQEEIDEGVDGNEVNPSYVKEIPHELMDRLNPVDYAPDSGSTDDHWEEYATLPQNHHHRHKHNPCFHAPCLHGGSCHFQHHVKVYKFKCSCRNGYVGHYCEHVPYSCHPNPCLHGGTCTKTKSGYFCTCVGDYKGHNCEEESSCLHNPCANSGICTETATGFYCQCGKGYTGKSCNAKLLPCSTNPCKNGATCRDLEDEERFECICPPGFGCVDCSCPVAIGTDHDITSQSGIQLIKSTTSSMITTSCPVNACRNGGSCFKAITGFSCSCPTGYHGADCGMPDLCNPNPCENNGVCVQDGEENYKCICPYGFKGADCQTPLACSSHPCMNGASCLETPDGYHCKCSLGYKGRKCTDLSPCSRNPCTHKATCIEKGALFTCSCRPGYRGKTCREKDPCMPNPCNNGVCGEINGIVSCNCTHGWMGDSCDIENLCQQNRCLNGATCVHTLEEFKCVCRDGYHGLNCEHHSPCLSRPCMNGGICEASGSAFVCRCEQGFHGERCNLRSNCHPNPCRNGGKCFEGDDTFVCECQYPFTGKFCEEQHLCLSQPCMNEAACVETSTSFQCKCLLGNYGRYCEMNVCEHNPCRNGGTCSPSSNTEHGYVCECVFPYHGTSCEEVDPCLPNPCKNGGTCHSQLQRYHESAFIHDRDDDSAHNENIISVVGPIKNDTFRHHSPYDRSQEVSYMPDAAAAFHNPHRYQDHPNSHVTFYESNEYIAHHAPIRDPHLKISHFIGSDDVVDETAHVHNRIKDLTGSKKSFLQASNTLQSSNLPQIKMIRDENAAKRTFAKYQQKVAGFTKPSSTSDDELTRRSNGARKRDQITVIQFRNQVIHDMRKRDQTITKRLKRLADNKVHKYRWRFSPKYRSIIPKVVVNIRKVETPEIVKRTLHDLYVCQCSSGYLGAHCQHSNPCQSNPCWNGATCIPHGEKFQCHCRDGYGGLKCDDPHPCLPNPCNHDGTCRLEKSIHGYACDCKPGFIGYNCEEQNLCMFTSPCQNGGKCVTIDDQIECQCRARFAGRYCEGIARFAGRYCEVDKCTHCDENAFCRHGHCVCKPLFVGNGFKCKALGDPCIPNPCDNHGECKEGQDGKIFTCECKPGYIGPRCEYPNPCSSSPCLHNSACIDESNSKEKGILLVDRHEYKCFCSLGYKGRDCEEAVLTSCASSPCVNNGTCFDSSSETHWKILGHIDDYECFCPAGYTGKNCEIPHYPCYSSPCLNGGHCLDSMHVPEASFDAHGYKCNCRKDYTGRNCEVTLEGPGPCHFRPCLNNGRCVDMRNNKDPDIHFDYDHEFKCFCDPQYSGKLCEVPYPACYSMPCLHNGSCVDRVKEEKQTFDESGFRCKCQPGYEGKNCERQYSFTNSEDEQFIRDATDLFDASPPATPMVVYVRPTHPIRRTSKNMWHPTLSHYFYQSKSPAQHAQNHFQLTEYSKMSQNDRLKSVFENEYQNKKLSNMPEIYTHTYFTADDARKKSQTVRGPPPQNYNLKDHLTGEIDSSKLVDITSNVNSFQPIQRNTRNKHINDLSVEQKISETAIAKHVIPRRKRRRHRHSIIKHHKTAKHREE